MSREISDAIHLGSLEVFHSMGEVDTCIREAKKALCEHNVKEALQKLKPFKKSLSSTDNVSLIQAFADAYLDDGQLEKAYPLLSRACELDADGKQGGSEKFFTLGQATGGQTGLSILLQGIENISKEAGEELNQEQTDKIVSGLLSMIEIWMTDLCMEAEAETQCEELLGKAMEISDGKSPEVWSMLGSVRISQQRFAEAIEAFTQSWNFFEIKRQDIERRSKAMEASSYEEHVQLLQPLLSLAKMCIEMGLYDISLNILNVVTDIDEDNLEAYYLQGFTYYMISKMEMFKLTNPDVVVKPENMLEFNQHFKELSLDLNNESLSETIHEAKIALSFAFRLGQNVGAMDELTYELVAGTEEILDELGGPLSDQELAAVRKGADGADIRDPDAMLDELCNEDI
ncbi:hypothetical protein HG536_0C01130 [Torulaspora globosa]|uniref:Assembly chaperone of RPL4 n=1 Tax=Torulaspora globosa TaxID=48254 RepID=A0A7G3ZEL0_9SACH|nr:uncharacterized protein HG536_0C01130 [Torulaspora globosa]QLL31946.1 hypothetical protein HG536_0C01130 [Torulaspora globosa]